MQIPALGLPLLEDPPLCAVHLTCAVVVASDAFAVPPTALDALGALLEDHAALTQLLQVCREQHGLTQQPHRPRHAACVRVAQSAHALVAKSPYAHVALHGRGQAQFMDSLPSGFRPMLGDGNNSVHRFFAEPRTQTLHQLRRRVAYALPAPAAQTAYAACAHAAERIEGAAR